MRVILAALLVLLSPLFAAAQPAAPPSDAEIRQAIHDLASPRFAVRQQAMKLLWNARERAEKHLRDAVNSDDPEVSRQVRVLLDRIAYRIDPDTPADIVELITQFRTASAANATAEQTQIIRRMLSLGSKGHPYLLRLLDAVDDQPRRLILDGFAYDDWKVFSSLLAEGHEKLLGQLLEKALASENDSVISHYAAFQAHTGRLDERLAEFRTRVEKTKLLFDARVLLALCRLKGDAEGALAAARRAEDPAWIRQILTEQGRWVELEREFPIRTDSGLAKVADLGHLAAYQRLSGRTDELPATIRQIHEYINDPFGPRANRPWFAAKVLLVNERPKEAMELLTKHEQFALAADILAGQAQFREALRLTEQAANAESGARYADRIMHINLLLRVGDQKQARDWLRKVTADMGESTEPGWLDRQIAILMQLGEHETAQKRLLARLERRDGSSLAWAFSALVPRLGLHAETAWQMLRKAHPKEEASALLARLRAINDGSAPPGEVADLLRGPVPVNPHSNLPTFDSVASLVVALRRPDIAKELLGQSSWDKASVEARLILADTLANASDWPAAAEAYRKITEQDRSAPLPLFLLADALRQIKAEDPAAKSLRERSHQIPLGSFATRYHFAEALAARGFAEDAHQELEFCSRLLTSNSSLLSAAQERLARSLAARGDHAAAANLLQLNMLRMMAIHNGLRTASQYGANNAEIHSLKALALLNQGQTALALREIEQAEALHAGHLDTAIRLAPALEKAGEKEKAAQLIERIGAPWKKACTDYPNCAAAHNNLAWLSARVRRDLDRGLTHAQRAVELSGNTPSYLDTLAELHFQRGERDQAIELARRCLTLPTSTPGYYRRQLQRFEHGAPTTDPPPE